MTMVRSIRREPDGWVGGWWWDTDQLWPWIGRYIFSVVILTAMILIAGPWAFFAYLALGWWLGRKVWREAMWLEAGEGMDLTAHAETCLIMTWAWSHPILIAAAWFARRI
jgi:hypothetical protein